MWEGGECWNHSRLNDEFSPENDKKIRFDFTFPVSIPRLIQLDDASYVPSLQYAS